MKKGGGGDNQYLPYLTYPIVFVSYHFYLLLTTPTTTTTPQIPRLSRRNFQRPSKTPSNSILLER